MVLKPVLRVAFAFLFLMVLFVCGVPAQEAAPVPQDAQVPASYEISGTARSGKTPLPGATVTAANTLLGKKYVVVTSADGKFLLSGMARGRYVVRIEFMGFARFTQ